MKGILENLSISMTVGQFNVSKRFDLSLKRLSKDLIYCVVLCYFQNVSDACLEKCLR